MVPLPLDGSLAFVTILWLLGLTNTQILLPASRVMLAFLAYEKVDMEYAKSFSFCKVCLRYCFAHDIFTLTLLFSYFCGVYTREHLICL